MTYNFFKKFKKPILIFAVFLLLVFAFSGSGLGARIPLPSWLPEALRDFFQRNPDFSMEPYKDGTIILVKPVQTGTGQGAYQAGDIVEIRDGSQPLSQDERTKLLPLYYPGKIPEELKQELMKPVQSDVARPEDVRRQNIDSNLPLSDSRGLSDSKTLARRAYGVDYTKFLSGSDILKVRRFEPLNQLPEIDLKVIIKKTDLLTSDIQRMSDVATLNSNLSMSDVPRTSDIKPLILIPWYLSFAEKTQSADVGRQRQVDVRRQNINSNLSMSDSPRLSDVKPLIHLPWYLSFAEKAQSVAVGQRYDSFAVRQHNIDSVVHLPWYLSFAEKTINAVSWLAHSLTAPAFADGVESVKVVDPGAGTGYNYLSLNTWEATEQTDLTQTTGNNTIAVAKCRSTNGKADTVAVTIAGWTTDATHYVKIWTDPNEPYRHNGKYDMSKYRLEVDGYSMFENNANYIKIDGLQFKENYSAANNANTLVSSVTGTSAVYISNNIVWGNAPQPVGYTGIVSSLHSGNTLFIWNNIVYGFNKNGYGTGIYFSGGIANQASYVYNNTVYGCLYGFVIDDSARHATLKNNLSYSNGTDYLINYGALDVNSTNNLSKDATAPAFGTYYPNATVTFASSTDTDFRLYATDTGAKGWGTNLTSDTILPLTSDVEGQSRPSSGAWDIGADQMVATQIYRSVGPGNTNALASGTSNALTISGATATFASGLPNNVGVGDVIQYATTTGTVNSLAFISGRISSTQYYVQDVAGHIASSTSANTGWSIFRAYISLANAESGLENTGINSGLRNFDDWTPGGNIYDDEGGKNLASSTEAWNIACYGDALDTTIMLISGWTTASSTYLKIYTPYLASEVGTSQRHNGKWDDGKYRIILSGLGGFTIGLQANYVRIEGLQIGLNVPYAYYMGVALYSNASNNTISHSIIRDLVGTQLTYGMYIDESANAPNNKIFNNIIYNFQYAGIHVYAGTVNTYVYNNTVINSRYYCFWNSSGGSGVVAKNNIAQNCNSMGFASIANGSDYNISSDSWTTGGAHDKKNVRVNFINTASSTEDFHLAPSDVWARDKGADLTSDTILPLTSDVDGQSRPYGAGWDIGADEQWGSTEINKPQTKNLLSNGLVGYWSFDGADMNNTSNSAYDRSGSYATGTMVNMATSTRAVPGISGQALKFDGVDDVVDVLHNTNLNAYPITISAWIKTTDTRISRYGIVDKYNGALNGYSLHLIGGILYGWYIPSNGNMVYDGGSGMNGGSVSNGLWHNVVMTIDSSGGALYVDSVRKTTMGWTGTAGPITTTVSLKIGDYADYSHYLNGLIDEVRVYNRALTATEITQLYNAGSAKLKVNAPSGTAGGLSSASGLVGYWSFDGAATNWTSATAGTTNDLSGSYATGTMTNMSRSTSPAIGISGQALKFDGVDDYVNIANEASFEFTQQFSLSTWIKVPVNFTGFGIITKYDGVSGWDMDIQPSPSGKLRMGLRGTSYIATDTVGPALNDNRWHHVSIVCTTASIKFYVDGSWVYTETGTWTATTNSLPVTIGTRNGESYANVSLDEVRIYNRALGAGEIQQLYNEQSGKAKFKKY